MDIIIEVLARHGRVRERVKCHGPLVSVGRGYHNDVILPDGYVCPQHLQLRFDEESRRWQVLDLSTRNGTFLIGTGRLHRPHELQSGDEFDLGETRIRLLLPQHEVAATRPLPTGRLMADYLSSPLIALALLTITLGLFVFAEYLEQGKESKLNELLLGALVFLAVPLVWACVWGFIGRVVVHEARFAFHLSQGSLLVMTLFLLSIAADYLGFGFSSDGVQVWLETLGEGVLICAFLLGGLQMATQMQRLKRWLVANGIAWTLVGIALLIFVVRSDPYDSQAGMSFALKPPFARLQPALSLDDYMAGLDETFAELAQFAEQKKAPGDGAASAEFKFGTQD